jgi:hypothetical protein
MAFPTRNPAAFGGGVRECDQAWQPIAFSIFRTAVIGKTLAALTRVDAAAWAAALIIASEWGWR